MGWKGIGHPIHPKCVFFDTNSEILGKALNSTPVTCMCVKIYIYILCLHKDELELYLRNNS